MLTAAASAASKYRGNARTNSNQRYSPPDEVTMMTPPGQCRLETLVNSVGLINARISSVTVVHKSRKLACFNCCSLIPEGAQLAHLFDSKATVMDKCLQHSCQFLHSRVSCRKQFAGQTVARPAARQTRSSVEQRCNASMGLGFTDGLILPRTSQPQIETPPNSYGLSIRQMAALGLSDDAIAKPLEANEVCNRLQRQL